VPGHRRSTRLPSFDYTTHGAYFFTAVTHQRQAMFGRVVDDDGVEFTDLGRIVDDEWCETARIRPNVELDQFVIMPNHIHGIVWLIANDIGEGSQLTAPTTQRFGSPVSRSFPLIVRAFKASVTRRAREARRQPDLVVWQRNYFERVIRNERELDAARQYIIDNPRTWSEDAENPDRLTKPRQEPLGQSADWPLVDRTGCLTSRHCVRPR
jgi:REP element-mobilizing transposase RayT